MFRNLPDTVEIHLADCLNMMNKLRIVVSRRLWTHSATSCAVACVSNQRCWGLIILPLTRCAVLSRLLLNYLELCCCLPCSVCYHSDMQVRQDRLLERYNYKWQFWWFVGLWTTCLWRSVGLGFENAHLIAWRCTSLVAEDRWSRYLSSRRKRRTRRTRRRSWKC